MCIRRTIALLAVAAVAGCSGSDSSSPAPESAAGTESAAGMETADRVTSPAGVTVDVTPVNRSVVEDGGRVSGGTSEAVQDPVTQLLAEMKALQLTAGTGSREAVDANRTIVLKATDVLKLTMQEPSRSQEFLDGIRHLLQARYQLALSGSRDDVEQLYSDAQALDDRDPESAAAAEGIYYLAKFAHTKARRVRQGKAEWNVSFSRWAREFASRFPEQQERAVSLLFGAGRSCEMTAATATSSEDAAMLRAESRLCYVLLVEKWPEEPQGHEAVAVLRRLNLPGHKLSQFSGPSLSGTMVNAEQFPGRVTLIYFWDSESRVFTSVWLPLLKKAEAQLSSERLHFVGVNLDDDVESCRRAVQELELPGEQICFQEESRRGWNSPLVRFWGVSQSPGVWLIGRDGVVDSVDVRRDEIVSRMKSLLRTTTASTSR